MRYWLYLTLVLFFYFTLTPEFYTLSLHDALPISGRALLEGDDLLTKTPAEMRKIRGDRISIDRKSTRLNSSHLVISYAVFCLKKKKKKKENMKQQKRLQKQKIQYT